MLPEIIRRCSSCGASTPDGSMFCPECGKALAEKSHAATPDQSPDALPAEEPGSAVPQIEKMRAEDDNPPGTSAEPQSKTKIETGDPDPDRDEAKVERQPALSPGPGKVERTREKLQQVSTAARGALEQNVKRADKIRHVSSAMLEEASYDPSLRFVLVALGVFVVFLLLLLLSKVMG